MGHFQIQNLWLQLLHVLIMVDRDFKILRLEVSSLCSCAERTTSIKGTRGLRILSTRWHIVGMCRTLRTRFANTPTGSDILNTLNPIQILSHIRLNFDLLLRLVLSQITKGLLRLYMSTMVATMAMINDFLLILVS